MKILYIMLILLYGCLFHSLSSWNELFKKNQNPNGSLFFYLSHDRTLINTFMFSQREENHRAPGTYTNIDDGF